MLIEWHFHLTLKDAGPDLFLMVTKKAIQTLVQLTTLSITLLSLILA